MWSFYANNSKLTLPLICLSAPLWAGPIEAPAPFGDMGSAMYSINDICQRLKTGEEVELKPFQAPTSGPQDFNQRCTLNEVMAVAPKKDDLNGAQITEVLSGKTY